MKTCTKCLISKDELEFSYYPRSRDGRRPHCKECRRKSELEAYHRNKEKHAARKKEYALANPEIVAERTRLWRKKNPEAKRAIQSRRRGRQLGAGGTHTASDIKKMLVEQGCQCVYCKCDISAKYHIDHIIPLAQGGSNGTENIQLLCQSCNLRKGALMPEEFERRYGSS